MTSHPYQLRRIELQDFKSVGDADVELAPLTVVVGANSSGKSTLLQSILAVTQAVRAGTGTAEFPLNGEFVRLGTFDETRNFLAQNEAAPMEIAFHLVDTLTLAWPGTRAVNDDEPLTQLTWRAYIDNAKAYGGNIDSVSGFARLASLQIEVGSISENDGGERIRILSCDLSDFAETLDASGNLRLEGPRARLSGIGGGTITATGRVQDWESGTSDKIDAIVMRGGVPQLLLRRMGRFDRLAEVWWNVAQDFLEDDLRDAKRKVAERDESTRRSFAAVRQALDDIRSLGQPQFNLPSSEAPAPRGNETWSDALDRQWYRSLAQLPPRRKASVATSMVQLGEVQFRKRLRKELRNEPWIDDEVLVEQSGAAGEYLWRCGAAAQRFFRSSVRYLGPLREAPHVLYDPGPSKLDLGIRGEYSAAVLHAQARNDVLMPTPSGNGKRAKLRDALDFWLKQFELAEDARSEDRGRTGIGLSVTPRGVSRQVDLTSVGVGVSQVLPVILLCLLAEPGTFLVLEQPELHLHPKLQQDLADFLLACTRSGRQLVVETHSEHLVNRLRYRIAEDASDETHDLIGFVFAENRGGLTRYREPEITSYGGLSDDWPDGFLDVTARESQQLVIRSLAKRKLEVDTSER